MRVRLKGVNRVRKKLADGTVKIFHYHRSTGTPLPGNPGSPEFLAALAKAEEVTPKDTGTIRELFRLYQGSLKFEKKRATTQREYRRMLNYLDAEFGDMPLRALRSPKVRGVFLDYQEEIGRDRPREADNRLSVLSLVFTHAASRGRIAENPLKGFEHIYDNDRADKILLEGDITRFMNGAPLELQQAMILALHTGQRYGDLIRMRWSDYDGATLRLCQSKGQRHVAIHATAALRKMLDGMERKGPFILTRADGRPWHTAKDDKALGKAWRARCDEVGIADRHFHDIRGTAVTMLSEAGATPQQIAGLTGHTVKSVYTILEKYLARTPALSKAAIIAFENAPATQFANRLQTTGGAKIRDAGND